MPASPTGLLRPQRQQLSSNSACENPPANGREHVAPGVCRAQSTRLSSLNRPAQTAAGRHIMLTNQLSHCRWANLVRGRSNVPPKAPQETVASARLITRGYSPAFIPRTAQKFAPFAAKHCRFRSRGCDIMPSRTLPPSSTLDRRRYPCARSIFKIKRSGRHCTALVAGTQRRRPWPAKAIT